MQGAPFGANNDENETTSKQRDNKEEASSKGPTIAGVSTMIVWEKWSTLECLIFNGRLIYWFKTKVIFILG